MTLIELALVSGELDGKALFLYRDAVYAGNFMAMRRAAFAPGTVEDSAKLWRLVEIAEEAIADGHKVVVFSFFRDVLGVVAEDSVDQRMSPPRPRTSAASSK